MNLNMVAICPTLDLRNTLIKAIAAAGGPKPVLKSNSESAQRAHYAPAPAKIIINTASEKMHQILGHHSVAVAIEVEDRIAAAKIAQMTFAEAGYEADVLTQAEPEFPDGFLTFVRIPALMGITLMFWPKSETIQAMDPAALDGLPKREPWTD